MSLVTCPNCDKETKRGEKCLWCNHKLGRDGDSVINVHKEEYFDMYKIITQLITKIKLR